MIRKKLKIKRIKKPKPPKIVRKKKIPKIYKYLVNYKFDGDLQKVLVEKEGKKEALIRMKGIFGNTIIGDRIVKETETHSLCDTLKEAQIKLIKHMNKSIIRHKNEIRSINKKIKETKKELEKTIIEYVKE